MQINKTNRVKTERLRKRFTFLFILFPSYKSYGIFGAYLITLKVIYLSMDGRSGWGV